MCRDRQSSLLAIEFSVAHGLHLRRAEDAISPSLLQALHMLCGVEARRILFLLRHQPGECLAPFDYLDGLAVFNPRGEPSKVVAKIRNGCLFI